MKTQPAGQLEEHKIRSRMDIKIELERQIEGL